MMTHTWIPCDANNRPPADTPMLVWATERILGGFREDACLVWCYDNCYGYGEPGEDFTHYMLIEEPTG